MSLVLVTMFADKKGISEDPMNTTVDRPLIVIGSMWSAVHPRSTQRLSESFEVFEFDLLQLELSISRLHGRTVDAAIIRIEWLDTVAPYVQALEASGTQLRHIIATEQHENMFPRDKLESLGICGIVTETGTHAAVLTEIFRVLSHCSCPSGKSWYSTKLSSDTSDREHAGISDCDRDILALVSAGLTNDEIASTLHYSCQTIRNRLSHLMKITHVRNRTELANAWRRYSIMQDLQHALQGQSIPTCNNPAHLSRTPH